MTSLTRRIHNHRRARQKLAQLVSNSAHVYVIHYSCESFYDRKGEKSPRITSIAIRNLGTGNTRSFSIHQAAEVKAWKGEEIEHSYNELERYMLQEYFEFVKSHLSDTWLHWNMRDIIFGFQALEHRYKVLGGKPVTIPESSCVDLSALLVEIYGPNYTAQPRLTTIIKRNQINDKDFLPGAEEAIAFEKREYFRMHLSTLRKVHSLAQTTELAEEGRLKTDTSWRDLYGVNPESIGEFLKDHWLVSIFTFLATLIGLIISLYQLYN
jgi:hypothetical protein